MLALKSSSLSHENTHALKAKRIPVPHTRATDCYKKIFQQDADFDRLFVKVFPCTESGGKIEGLV